VRSTLSLMVIMAVMGSAIPAQEKIETRREERCERRRGCEKENQFVRAVAASSLQMHAGTQRDDDGADRERLHASLGRIPAPPCRAFVA
jgi:hypothetical protein